MRGFRSPNSSSASSRSNPRVASMMVSYSKLSCGELFAQGSDFVIGHEFGHVAIGKFVAPGGDGVDLLRLLQHPRQPRPEPSASRGQTGRRRRKRRRGTGGGVRHLSGIVSPAIQRCRRLLVGFDGRGGTGHAASGGGVAWLRRPISSLGNGMAGLSAALGIRERDRAGRIVLIGDEGIPTTIAPRSPSGFPAT